MDRANADLDDKLYCYPDSNTLRNKLGIKSRARLDKAEHYVATLRSEQGIPTGGFDAAHIKSIHHHLCQDVYEWAGQTRQTLISRDDFVFSKPENIEAELNEIHQRLETQNYLKDMSRLEFSEAAGVVIGDINRVHPFREGNTRTQLQFLKELGKEAGHIIDLTEINREQWLEATNESNRGNYTPLQICIRDITLERSQYQDRSKSQDRGRER